MVSRTFLTLGQSQWLKVSVRTVIAMSARMVMLPDPEALPTRETRVRTTRPPITSWTDPAMHLIAFVAALPRNRK